MEEENKQCSTGLNNARASSESEQTPSDLSEAELVSLGDDENSKPNAKCAVHLPILETVHPEFAFEDANVEVQTGDQVFWVHEFQLNKLAKIGSLIRATRKEGSVSDSGNRVKIICDADSVDFYNALRVLYAPAILGVPDFEVDTLISALRIASSYDYPDLRNFAIEELEKCSLPAIDQIELSDEFSLPHWEKPAFVDLCYRAEPITSHEARILGVDRFTEIARIRETQQRRHFVKLFDKSVQPCHLLAQMGGPDQASALRRDAEISSCRGNLPECNCKIHKSESGSRSISLCQIHELAPAILKESRTLLEQRNQLLNRLASLNKALATEKLGAAGEICSTFVENELDKASWIRRESSTGGTVM
ncbi:hypothetical protein RHS04_04312 [Rhizoctonia solani]|uniref:BTB domain-containing protein n=1 Tax=Rhizoctonia solani TaxID=456999 RepID=A0A8H7H983_9AGAM|nr:hypothetical protein RHS04_04312 [Rhizoctonia solani]